MADSAKDIVALVRDRRKAFTDWFRDAYMGEIEDAWRSTHNKVEPIYLRDPKTGNRLPDPKKQGNFLEDTSRTNVCMPWLWRAVRTKKARLTANPPQYKFTGPVPEQVTDALAAYAVQRYDRSGEAIEHKRGIHQAVVIGFTVLKSYWDEVVVDRVYTYDVMNQALGNRVQAAQMLGRGGYMKLLGAPQDEIQGAVSEQGDQYQPEELNAMVAQHGEALSGDELSAAADKFNGYLKLNKQVKKYEGPCVKNVFFGDFAWEPGTYNLHDSWQSETYYGTAEWARKKAKQQYKDYETGEMRPVCDQAALDDVVDQHWEEKDDQDSIKKALRASINQTDPKAIDKQLLSRKKFKIEELHDIDENGCWGIYFIANDKVCLNSIDPATQKPKPMPYPYDFYGKSAYTPLVPMPDLVDFVGDSAPRAMRFLHKLHNRTVGDRKDLVRKHLRPTLLIERSEDVSDQVIETSAFRAVIVKNLNGAKWQENPQIPPAAYQEEAQIWQQVNYALPETAGIDAGNTGFAEAGKTATTAVIHQKNGDILTLDELSYIDLHLKERQEKALWMMQQQEGVDSYQIEPQYATALSDRYGSTVNMKLDPIEIQEDIQVEPVAGSMLAIDDDLKVQSAQQFFMQAASNPDVFNKRYAAQNLALTMRGVDKNQAVVPEPPPKPPIEKVGFNITAKFSELPANIQAYFLGQMPGAPPLAPETVTKGMADTLGHVERAANSLHELTKTPEESAHEQAMMAQAKESAKPKQAAK